MAPADNKLHPIAVSLVDAAHMLAIAPRTLRKWSRERRLPSARLGSRLVFRISDLHKFLDQNLKR